MILVIINAISKMELPSNETEINHNDVSTLMEEEQKTLIKSQISISLDKEIVLKSTDPEKINLDKNIPPDGGVQVGLEL